MWTSFKALIVSPKSAPSESSAAGPVMWEGAGIDVGEDQSSKSDKKEEQGRILQTTRRDRDTKKSNKGERRVGDIARPPMKIQCDR